MGPQRRRQDPHEQRHSPKLSMAGRLDGSIDGRPFIFRADGDLATFSTPHLRALWKLRRHRKLLGSLRRAAEYTGNFKLMASLPWLGRVEIYPRPGLLVRLILS